MKKPFNNTLFYLIIALLSFKTTTINAQNEEVKKKKKVTEKFFKIFLSVLKLLLRKKLNIENKKK